jgi:hypothetical protein
MGGAQMARSEATRESQFSVVKPATNDGRAQPRTMQVPTENYPVLVVGIGKILTHIRRAPLLMEGTIEAMKVEDMANSC